MWVTGHLLSQCTFTASGRSRPSDKEGEGCGGGGHPDPDIWGAWSLKIFFRPFGRSMFVRARALTEVTN